MKKVLLSISLLLASLTPALTQNRTLSKLKIFIDCSSAWCDMQYIRSEINAVDFLHDNTAADVHVLITSQGTGGGGEQYQLIFFGQHQFKGQVDTLLFSTDPNAIDFEKRNYLLKHLKLGLVPFIAKTGQIKNIEISLKTTESTDVNDTSSYSKVDLFLLQ